MSALRLRLGFCFGILLFLFVLVSHGGAEPVQRGDLRVSFSASLQPKLLPRKGAAPISVTLGGRISTTDGTNPPALRRIQIAINRNGRLDPGAVPVCRLGQIQPSTTAYARRACGAAEVGEGTFTAAVAIPEQSPYPSSGTATAFNGRENGRPVVFLHVYGTEPLPTSFTMPLRISRGHGSFGTVLSGDLPSADAHVGFVTGIALRLDGGRSRHSAHPYLSAGCPAPSGFSIALFPLARTSFSFAKGPTLATTLTRSCHARG